MITASAIAKAIKCQSFISPHEQKIAKSSTKIPIKNCVTTIIFLASPRSTKAPPFKIKKATTTEEAIITRPKDFAFPVSSIINQERASSWDHRPIRENSLAKKKTEKLKFLKGASRCEKN